MAAQPAQRYKVLERIAAGGMAEVFRAESAGLEGFKKLVAIKRVLPHLSEKKQFIGMFLDEARVCAHLSHSNCVQVFDIGVGDNTYFIVMEFVDGSDLKGVIEARKKVNQPFPLEEACLICVRICEGLSYAHELVDSKGQSLHIVHRDMSPPNVLITRFGEVKIVDFGLAKANSQLEHSEPGIIKGKFSYLSPEAAQGLPVDARTDGTRACCTMRTVSRSDSPRNSLRPARSSHKMMPTAKMSVFASTGRPWAASGDK